MKISTTYIQNMATNRGNQDRNTRERLRGFQSTNTHIHRHTLAHKYSNPSSFTNTLLCIAVFDLNLVFVSNSLLQIATQAEPAATLRWFASDTAHIALIHITSVMKPVHIFMT